MSTEPAAKCFADENPQTRTHVLRVCPAKDCSNSVEEKHKDTHRSSDGICSHYALEYKDDRTYICNVCGQIMKRKVVVIKTTEIKETVEQTEGESV